MEPAQPMERPMDQPRETGVTSGDKKQNNLHAQSAGGTCTHCGGVADGQGAGPPAYIYALGRIEARFPSLAVEKEFAQVTGRSDTTGLTDRQALQKIMSERSNRYLARQLCWVLTIEGLETYLLQPRDSVDLDLLVQAVRPAPHPTDLDVVIGMRGPIAPPEICNGLMLPIVAFDQIYSFDRESLIKSIPRPEKTAAKEFAPAAEELFDRIMQMADNAGATDEHRCLNYCAVRYPAIYAKAGECFGMNSSLTSLEVQTSLLSDDAKLTSQIGCNGVVPPRQ